MSESNEKQHLINPETLKELREKQQKKDLDGVIQIFESLSEEEQSEFIRDFASKDPVYREIINELTPFLQWKSEAIISSHINETPSQNKENHQQSQERTPLLWETQNIYLDKNSDFQPFLDSFVEKEVNWQKEVILTPEAYEWFLRYDSNKEPLAKALWQAEINKAKEELQERLKASSNMPFAPENMDASRKFAKEQFEQREKEIIQKYLPQTEKFVGLMKNTDIWRKIIANTTKSTIQENLKSSIDKNISNESWKETELWRKIESQTMTLLSKLWEIQKQMDAEIRTFKETQENFKQREYLNYERVLYQDIPQRYEWLIKKEFRNYAFSVWEELIKSNAQIVTDQKEFNLPLWTWEEIVLDFWKLWDTKWKSQEEILNQFNQKFNNVYIDDLSERLFREITSKKWIIDIVWIVISWILAIKYSIDSFWLWIPSSAVIFTASENTYRAIAYEIFQVEWWALAWIWIDEKDTTQDVIRKKLFELASNWVLFSIFRVTWMWEKTIASLLKNPEFMNDLSYKISSYWVKTWIEAWFFTYYTVATNNLQQAIQKSPNKQEVIDSFTNIWNMQDFMRLFAYNIWFVMLVKWWWTVAEKQIVNRYEKQINEELKRLEWSWIFLVDWVFYRWNNVLTQLPKEEFWKILKLNQELWKFSGESLIKWEWKDKEKYRKPWSWNAGKTINTDYPNPAERFIKLEKYSRETQKWWVKQALWDSTIWQTLENQWLNS